MEEPLPEGGGLLHHVDIEVRYVTMILEEVLEGDGFIGHPIYTPSYLYRNLLHLVEDYSYLQHIADIL